MKIPRNLPEASRGLRLASLISILIALFTSWSWGGECAGDSAVYRTLPKEIGRENEIFKTPYTLPCDSMVVRAGDTTLIHGNTLVHFGSDPSTSSRIHVHGRLVILGDANRPVYFSATVRLSESGGYIPGNQVWDGIEVAETGQIESRHARFFSAPTSILSRSRNVFMESSYFRGSSGLIFPDTNVYLATQGTTLQLLDLRSSRPEITGRPDAVPQNTLTDKQAHSTAGVSVKGRSRWIYYSLGVISVAAVAGITWIKLSPESSTSSNPPIPNPPILSLDPDPTLPGLPPPR